MSKGSNQRPTDKAAFDNGYERIWGSGAWGDKNLPKQGAIEEAIAKHDTHPNKVWNLQDDGSLLPAGPSPEFTGKITLPNQTCGNCRHWEKESDFDLGEFCKNHSVRNMIEADGGFDFEPPADFGCNRWEAKV